MQRRGIHGSGDRREMCNLDRVFHQKSTSKGIRNPKKVIRKTGPSQIDNVCTAGYNFIEKEGSFVLTLYPTHTNHPLDKKHMKCLRMPAAQKQKCIQVMNVGAPIAGLVRKINDDVRENYSKYKEEHAPHLFTSYQNLSYLKKSNVVDTNRKDSDDFKSVQKWASERPNDIIYHKFHGDIDPQYPVSKTLFMTIDLILI